MSNFSTTLIVALIVYSLASFIIVYARGYGAKALKKCFPNLLPAQAYLLPSNNIIDSETQKRYYAFFARHIDGFKIFETDEQMKPMVCTAITWLISQTRDAEKFPLILEENMNLGFAYNLLGLKSHGIITTIIGLIINALLAIMDFRQILQVHFQSLIMGSIIHILFLLFWILIVTKSLVITCGKNYARTLLSACDSPHFD